MRLDGYGAGVLSLPVPGSGMGCRHALNSRGLRRLGLLWCLLCFGSTGSGAHVRRFSTACRSESTGPNTGEEGVELRWDVQIVEEEASWGVTSP